MTILQRIVISCLVGDLTDEQKKDVLNSVNNIIGQEHRHKGEKKVITLVIEDAWELFSHGGVEASDVIQHHTLETAKAVLEEQDDLFVIVDTYHYQVNLPFPGAIPKKTVIGPFVGQDEAGNDQICYKGVEVTTHISMSTTKVDDTRTDNLMGVFFVEDELVGVEEKLAELDIAYFRGYVPTRVSRNEDGTVTSSGVYYFTSLQDSSIDEVEVVKGSLITRLLLE